MSEEENHFGEDDHKSDAEGEKTSDKGMQDLDSPAKEDEEEKVSIEEEKASIKDDDDDFREITYDKGDSGIQDENEEDDQDDKIKKLGKKKMKDVRKKVKRGEDSDGENKDFDVSDNDFDVEAPKKTGKKGKRASNKLDEDTVTRECDEVLQAMEEAYDRDKISNKQKKPALEKLKYIKSLAAALRKPQVQERFLNNKGLDMISKWLEKMPDGSTPGQTLKKKLIEIVSTLPVDQEHVSETTLSKKLYEYYKNPKEDVDLKKTLKIIIDKFSRAALLMSVDYSNKNEEGNTNRKRESSYSLDENLRKEKINDIFHNPLKPYERRTLNKRVGYSFTVAPQSVGDKDIKTKRSNSGADYDKVYTDYKRRKNQKKE